VLARIDLRGHSGDPAALLPRAPVAPAASDTVAEVCDAVRRDGLSAVLAATARFDGVQLESTRVPADALAAALAGLDPAVRAALEEATRRARLVHQAQLRADETVEVAPGATVTERWVPVRRVGLYVPGGRVAYPSSVVMNVVPAQVAGVQSLALASPPQQEYAGLPHPAILAACALPRRLRGLRRSAGRRPSRCSPTAPASATRVDLVTGPGQRLRRGGRKRLVKGRRRDRLEAGPTEIAILADDTADPGPPGGRPDRQAEHDPLAACCWSARAPSCSTPSTSSSASRCPATRHASGSSRPSPGSRARAGRRTSTPGSRSWTAGPPSTSRITRDAAAVAVRVRNAGAVFVGAYSPVSLGDYLAGSNHVLPTAGTARHTGGLSVGTFLRGIHVVDYSRDALAAVGDHITALGGAEDLAAHVEAVQVRLR
jgi:histidinol dehydrogenase